MTSDPNGAAVQAAFARAVSQWEAFIADPITLTIDLDFAPLGIGGTGCRNACFCGLPSTTQFAIKSCWTRLLNQPDDTIALSIPTAAMSTFDLPNNFTLSGNIEATKANLKALGFTGLDAQFGPSDGQITFGSGINYDFDNSDGVTPGSIDFESVAAHEIGHILGVISAVDVVDSFLDAGVNNAAISPTPFDLFRFEDGVNDPSTVAEFTSFPRSLVPGSVDVFDQVLPGPGLTELPLSDGVTNQASHFLNGLSLGALNPVLNPGEIVTVGTNDFRVLDLIGFDINLNPAAVPEPGMASLVLLLAAPAMLRRRRA